MRGYAMKKYKSPPDPKTPLTDDEFDAMPHYLGIEGLPDEAREAVEKTIAKNKIGRPPVEHPKEKVTIRLDRDLLDVLRESGKGWQTRLNDIVRQGLNA